ncbi:YmaF family protein, partial [Clostridium botulinum]|uniref:YmaF family protein n=1 Tax=Clostridium botulinum TaxID=1491 RepID=UPI000A2549B0
MCNCKERQTHVHEFLGSTRLAEPHNHRFAGVSGQAIRSGNSHVHRITTNTA